MEKKPHIFLILKIIGFIGVIVGIIGFILTFTGFGDFESNNFMIGGFLATTGMFVGITCLLSGFRPEIARLTTKTTKYIQQENKDDLTDIANTTADISGEAITKTTNAIKKGLEKDKIYCKYCGEHIDVDSIFCNKCGKKQK